MTELASESESFEADERQQYEAGRAEVLTAIAAGEYDPATTPQEIAEKTGVGLINVRQLTFGMIAYREITWGTDPETGMLRMVLTESGEEHLARFSETC